MEFKKYSLDQLLIHIVDNRGRTCPTSEQGIPLIATNCIKQDSLFPVFEKSDIYLKIHTIIGLDLILNQMILFLFVKVLQVELLGLLR